VRMVALVPWRSSITSRRSLLSRSVRGASPKSSRTRS
jgi:hypothetical protein